MPSYQFPSSHVILGVSVISAPTEEEAEYQAASTTWPGSAPSARVRAAAEPRGGDRIPLSPQERVIVDANRQRHFIGTPFKVANTIRHLVDDTGADEIMVTSMMYGRDARFQAYELLAAEWGLGPTKTPELGDFLPGLWLPGHGTLRPEPGFSAVFSWRGRQGSE